MDTFLHYLARALAPVCDHYTAAAQFIDGLRQVADLVSEHPQLTPMSWNHHSFDDPDVYTYPRAVFFHIDHWFPTPDETSISDALDTITSSMRPQLAMLRDHAPIGTVSKDMASWKWGLKRTFPGNISFEVYTASELTCHQVETDEVEEVEVVDAENPTVEAARAALAEAEAAAKVIVERPVLKRVCVSITEQGR